VTTLESLRQRKAEIERLARSHGARDVRIFGSVARNEDAKDSDIDVLIDMSDEASLLDLVQLQQALEVMLDRRADVLTVRGINLKTCLISDIPQRAHGLSPSSEIMESPRAEVTHAHESRAVPARTVAG
jgi:hypothetical protein